jgi:hypothetical protein
VMLHNSIEQAFVSQEQCLIIIRNETASVV